MILVFIGDNTSARDQALSDFITGFTGAHGTSAVDRLDGVELELGTLLDAVMTLPFLSQRRLVIVRDLNSNKALSEDIERIVASVADTTDLVIVEGHVDKRSKYLSSLKKLVEVREFAQLEGAALIDWMVERVKSRGGSLNRALAQMVIDRVGTNQQMLGNELDKLVLYKPVVDENSVATMTTYTPQSSIFAMLDNAFAGNTKEAFRLYAEQREQGMEPNAIFGMIVWQLHILCVVKSAGAMPADELASLAKLNPYVVRKNQANARRLSDQKINRLLDQAITIDAMIKTSRTSAEEAVQNLLMTFA